MIRMERRFLLRILIRHPRKGYRVWKAWRAYKKEMRNA